jgi:hypothetical protein
MSCRTAIFGSVAGQTQPSHPGSHIICKQGAYLKLSTDDMIESAIKCSHNLLIVHWIQVSLGAGAR